MKRMIQVAMGALLISLVLSGCGKGAGDSLAGGFNTQRDITVVSREDGSGTRGAFIELLNIEIKTAVGNKKDMTTKEAVIANKTDIMMTNIANDWYAIGYLSLGSLNDSVKALEIDLVPVTGENIQNEKYGLARPFNIATKGEPTGLAKDFIGFILSTQGQEVVQSHYIPITDKTNPYEGDKPSGKITVAGSSSVSPIMEKLKEAYGKINAQGIIEIQMSDSSAGMTGVIEGTCDIGMASRDLKDSEKEILSSQEIALDGIAIIVNKENTLNSLTREEIRRIFTGEISKWIEIIK